MKERIQEVHQRLIFIDQTLSHATRACHADTAVSTELKDALLLLRQQSTQARQAVHSDDAMKICRSIEYLAQLSDQAQNAIRPADSVSYEVKSSVILAYLEVCALKLRIEGFPLR